MNGMAWENINVWNTALYIRLSVEDERKKVSGSVKNQRNFLLNYIQDKPDMVLYSIYEDVQQTGADFERPEFKRLMADIRSGGVNCVVVKDLSRFGRNFLDSSEYIEQIFPMLGVRFVAVNDEFDSIKPEDGQAMGAALKNLMNDIVLKDLSQRIKSSMASAMKRGDYQGTYPPYGYVIEKEEEGGRRLVVDPETAPVVKQIFRWRIEGYGCMKIADLLNQKGIIPPRKRLCRLGLIQSGRLPIPDRWGVNTIRQMLRNPLFLGNMVQHRWERPGISVKKLVRVNPEDWICVPNTHEAIVAPEEYEKANQPIHMENKRKKTGIENNRQILQTPNLLCGLVYCKKCGQPMIRCSSLSQDRTARRYRFRCSWCRQHTTYSNQIAESILLQAITDTIFAQIGFIDQWKGGVREEARPAQEEIQANKTKITKLKRNISTLKTSKRGLYEKFTEGKVSKQEYYLQKSQLESRLTELNCEMDSLYPFPEKNLAPNDKDKGWTAFIDSLNQKKELTQNHLHMLVKTIWVDGPQKIEIELAYSSPFIRCFFKEEEKHVKQISAYCQVYETVYRR